MLFSLGNTLEIASIDGIGKGLDEDYDLGEFAQPFVTKLIDKVKYGGDNSKKSLAVFGKATGLNAEDVNTALTQPRKIAYLEETMRSIEQGQLKIRVRSLENEMALTRLGTQSSGMTNLLLSSLVLLLSLLVAMLLLVVVLLLLLWLLDVVLLVVVLLLLLALFLLLLFVF